MPEDFTLFNTQKFLLCLTPDDFTRQRETPEGLKG